MHKRTMFVLLAVLAALPATAGAAAPTIHPEEEMSQLTAFGKPSVTMGSQFRLAGKPIGRDEAVKRGYACLDVAGPTIRCYVDRKALAAAENVRVPGVSIASKRHSHRAHKHSHRARSATHAGNPMILSMGLNNTGAAIGVYVYCSWYNLDGSWNDNAESGYSGNHSAIVAEHWSGYGSYISGGAYTTWTTFGGLNNAVSSAYRYGC